MNERSCMLQPVSQMRTVLAWSCVGRRDVVVDLSPVVRRAAAPYFVVGPRRAVGQKKTARFSVAQRSVPIRQAAMGGPEHAPPEAEAKKRADGLVAEASEPAVPHPALGLLSPSRFLGTSKVASDSMDELSAFFQTALAECVASCVSCPRTLSQPLVQAPESAPAGGASQAGEARLPAVAALSWQPGVCCGVCWRPPA